MGGGSETLGDPGDQVACGVSSSSVAVKNPWSEADAAVLASGGRVVERPSVGLITCQVPCRGRRAAQSQASKVHVFSVGNPHGGG